MVPRFLLDTHVVVRWLIEKRRLSREQLQTLERAVRNAEPLAVSAMTLLEIAMLTSLRRLKVPLAELLADIEASPVFRILPLTSAIALEVAALGSAFRDPSDRVIVATARVHGLRLITSDEEILNSQLVPTVE